MQMLKIFIRTNGVANHCPRENVQSARVHVDYRRGSDAYFGLDKWAFRVPRGDSRHAAIGIEKTDLPEWRITGTVGVEGIDAVVFGGDEDDIMFTFAGNFQRRHEQWLRVNGAINFEGAEFAELFRIHVLRS